MKLGVRVLIVEDSMAQLGHLLEVVRTAGFEPRAVVSLAEAKEALRDRGYDVLLTDIHLTSSRDQDSFEGMELLSFMRTEHPDVLCLAMSSDPKIETYREAARRGAVHFFRKPILGGDEFRIGVESARSRRGLLAAARRTLGGPFSEGLAGRFPDGLVIDEHTRTVSRKVALSRRLPLTLYGETGTGKEEIARLVHRYRVELDGNIPFVAVNCANLNGDLAASLLFGHRKGAFTGADQTTTGFIGEANGGILFLDEIHALHPACQQRLLRVLNDGSYERVGESRPLRSDFQVIAASTKDLDAEADAGRFLLDLRMRLTGVDLELPPLRERLEDLPDLIHVALAREGVSINIAEVNRIAERCKQYLWKGNIRQLFRVIQTLVVMASFNEEEIRAENLPVFRSMVASEEHSLSPRLGAGGLPADATSSLARFLVEDEPIERALETFEKLILQAAMARHEKVMDVAKALGMARSTLDLKRKKHGL
jgi:DNA-binding NtrC family response regulator